ncbi:hypothetical protein FHS68_004136 [Dyadobacter arcticus]|uniref:DUF4907 domain-containing protein n=1 Tax=Dyadobacter arcticus TaxID=1078754 RepID=A0ABX0UPP4_9BACT|nr:hypothetical protein [Dyadobacter arcticus]
MAFAVAVYFFLPSRTGISNGNDEGLSQFRVEAFKKETGWGYRIYQDTTAVIEQTSVPGVPGKSGFATEELARKTGQLVQRKLDQGIFPPTITANELDSLGIR